LDETKGATRRHIGLVASILLVAAGSAGAQARKATEPAATGEGTLMVDGKTVTLKHAYARAEEYLDKKLPVVLLSDRPVSAEALASGDAWEPFDTFAREGQAHTVRLRFDDKGELVKIWIHHPAFESALQAHPPGQLMMSRFDRQGIEGKYRMEQAEEFFKHRWQLTATFKVPMPAGAAVP
jgi:hypothetical protein